MLQFCPVCKNLLELKRENEKNLLSCRCGFKRFSNIELSSLERPINPLIGEGVIKEDKSSFGIDHLCSKCGYDKAEILELGERSSDESSVNLFKCLKCANISRDN